MDKNTPSAPIPAKILLLRALVARGYSSEAILEEFKRVAVLLGLPLKLGAAAFRGWRRAAVLVFTLKRRFTPRRRQLESDDLFYSKVAAYLTDFRAGLPGDSLRLLRDETTGRPGMQHWMRKTIEDIVNRARHDTGNKSRLGDAGRWEAVAAAAGWGELSGEVARIIADMLGE